MTLLGQAREVAAQERPQHESLQFLQWQGLLPLACQGHSNAKQGLQAHAVGPLCLQSHHWLRHHLARLCHLGLKVTTMLASVSGPDGRPLISKEANSSGAIEKLQSEHVNSQQHIKDLEAKLEKLQSNLQVKIKALDAIEEKNASLHEEIISLRNTFHVVNRIEGAAHSISSIPRCPLQFQHSSDYKASIAPKCSDKVLFSQFPHSGSTINSFSGKSSSRMVRFPISSLQTLDKSLEGKVKSLDNQQLPCLPPKDRKGRYCKS
nr:uncharacterized protein LOC132777219 [Anolis sagrei ordinatus]